MNAKHTPEPWTVGTWIGSAFGYTGTHEAVWRDDLLICATGIVGTPESAENAALIAAAPGMLAALRECITSEGAQCFGDIRGNPLAMQRRLYAVSDIARAAIARAEGKS